MRGFIEVLWRKHADLRGIADWASMVCLGTVRDHCRLAMADLEREIRNMEEHLDAQAKATARAMESGT